MKRKALKIYPDEEELIVEMYSQDNLIIDIASFLERDRMTIRKVLNKRIGNKRIQNYRREFTTDIENQVVTLFNEGNSSYNIAKALGFGHSTIICKENDLGLKRPQKRIYTLAEDYFNEIDTEEKAYFLGFIIADGHVSSHGVRLVLAQKDQSILENLKIAIGSDKEVSIITVRGNKYAEFMFHSIKMVKTLRAIGIDSNKTLLLKGDMINKVSKNLQRHFIRGFFDGDGCINKVNNNHFCSLQMLSTESFLKGISETLYDWGISKITIRKEKRSNVYILYVNRRPDIKILYDNLYGEASVFLQRKKNRFEEWNKMPYRNKTIEEWLKEKSRKIA